MSTSAAVVTGAPVRPRTIHQAVSLVAAEYPDRAAVLTAQESVSFGQLQAASARIASALVARGVRPGDIVPVVARRTAKLPAVLLGVLRAGAAYAMIDVRWPAARIARLTAAVRPPLVLADQAGSLALSGASIPHLPFTEFDDGELVSLPEVRPDDCAMLFWTSGSTGSPKGVLSPHKATTRLFADAGCVPFGEVPVMISAAAVPWDAFTFELWSMLTRGGSVLIHEDDLLLAHTLRSHLEDFAVTHLFLTPALFDVFVAGDVQALAGLQVLTVGGDRLSPSSCRALLAACPQVALYNGYGPVESCVFATTHQVTAADVGTAAGIPLGRAVGGTGIVVHRDGEPVIPGEIGEIAITGDGLAIGYLNEPDRTAEAFGEVTVGSQAQRAYFTGDQGWLDDDGVLHFAGRLDSQFKIAGHRIEPAEIELAARQAGCSQAVAIPLRTAGSPARIVLFAVPSQASTSAEQISDALRARLPVYMVPAAIHLLEQLPLLENTKIDRLQLAGSHGYLPPGGEAGAALRERPAAGRGVS